MRFDCLAAPGQQDDFVFSYDSAKQIRLVELRTWRRYPSPPSLGLWQRHCSGRLEIASELWRKQTHTKRHLVARTDRKSNPCSRRVSSEHLSEKRLFHETVRNAIKVFERSKLSRLDGLRSAQSYAAFLTPSPETAIARNKPYRGGSNVLCSRDPISCDR
jgi:hypothetical protein